MAVAFWCGQQAAGPTRAPVHWRMSLANKITISRILLAPGIVAALVYYDPSRDWLRYLALSLFVAGIISDALDGLIARLYNERSELGTLLDPIADKALILSTLISCSAIHGLPSWLSIPAWFNLVVITRDVLLVCGATIVFANKGRWLIRPSWMGKCTTVAQMLVVVAVLLRLPIKTSLVLLATALTVLSGIHYLWTGVRALE